MEVKFTLAEREHLDYVREIHAERKREFLQIEGILDSLLEMLARNHSVTQKRTRILPDGSGFVVQDADTPLETGGT